MTKSLFEITHINITAQACWLVVVLQWVWMGGLVWIILYPCPEFLTAGLFRLGSNLEVSFCFQP